jgi:hypothetical protein
MIIMAEAAPGATPQIAVVPGSTLRRLIAQPSKPLTRMITSTTPMNSGQSLVKEWTMSAVSARPMRQPTMVCAASTGSRGALMRPPLMPISTPASIAPSRNAAGSPVNSSRPPNTTDRPMSAAHCASGVRRAKKPAAVGGGIGSLMVRLTRRRLVWRLAIADQHRCKVRSRQLRDERHTKHMTFLVSFRPANTE